MTIILGAPSNELLEWVRLAVTAAAAIAVVVAAVVTAVLTTRRESDSWLREHRADAYRVLLDAVDESIDRVAMDVSDSLHHPTFAGLDDARAAALASQGPVNRGMLGALLFAGEALPELSAKMTGIWGDVLSRSAPISGVANGAALDQYLACLDLMAGARIGLLTAMRHDLRRRTLFKRKAPQLDDVEAELEKWANEQEANPRKTLIDWKVRRWTSAKVDFAEESVGYVTDTHPWALVHATSSELAQPLAAVLRRIPDTPWLLAISDEVTDPADVAKLELAALRTVVHHGSGGVDPLGYGRWAEAGPTGEEKLHFWPLSLLQEKP